MADEKQKKKKITIPQDSDVKDAIDTSDFKQSLVDTLQESNTARNEMKVVLHEILQSPETIAEVKNIIDKTDRDNFKLFLKKFGFLVVNGISLVIGVIVTILITRLLR